MIRVVVDTNLWISFLIGKCVKDMTSVLEDERVELIATPILLEEIEEVVGRPKFRPLFSEELAKAAVRWIKGHATFVNIVPPIPSRCRDCKDDYLLELAVQSNAVYLVSGDNDLLTIGAVADCRILTFRQFCTELGISTKAT